MEKPLNYVYDIETYPNFFCAVFANKDEVKVFEISGRKNDLEDLYYFYKPKNIKYCIGYNNVRFDAPILEELVQNYPVWKDLKSSEIVTEIYDFAQKIIESQDKSFSGGGRPKYPEWKLSVPQLDIFLQNGYNTGAKSCSLKYLEFSIRYNNVQDLPYSPIRLLKPENFDEVIKYCINDVLATQTLAKNSSILSLMKLRLEQHKQYPKLGLLNKADAGVGEQLFLYFMSEHMKIDMKELRKRQTPRNQFDIEDILLPYINFKTPEFQEVLNYYKLATWYNNKEEGSSLSYVKNYKGMDYVFGEGGLHASWNNRIFEANDEYEIYDWDVTSFYPNLAIVNGFRPEHLGEAFSKVYNNIFEKRRTFKKGTVENQSYKIILNGVYGKSKDKFSFLYDPKMQQSICINGQLLLCMLAERFSLIPGVEIIQCNTDGTTIRIPKDKKDQMFDIVKKWEKLTGLQLESAEYSKMVINDVNNYMAVYTNGKVKYKGSWEIDKDLHKNSSNRIVPIALKRYFTEGVAIKDTIKNHIANVGKDYPDGTKNYGIFDFCQGLKVQKGQRYIVRQGVNDFVIKGKVLRLYVTTEKIYMYKQYIEKTNSEGKTKEEAVNKGYCSKVFMDYEDKLEADYKLNYEYYINECYKITTLYEGGNPKQGFQMSIFDLIEE